MRPVRNQLPELCRVSSQIIKANEPATRPKDERDTEPNETILTGPIPPVSLHRRSLGEVSAYALTGPFSDPSTVTIVARLEKFDLFFVYHVLVPTFLPQPLREDEHCKRLSDKRSRFPNHLQGIFVVSERNELGMSQVIGPGPLQELDLCD